MEAMEIQYYRLEIEQLDELIEAKKELKLVQLKFELIIDAFFNEMQTKEININKFIEVQSLLSGKILMWLDTIVGDYTNSAGIYVTFLKKINRDLHFMYEYKDKIPLDSKEQFNNWENEIFMFLGGINMILDSDDNIKDASGDTLANICNQFALMEIQSDELIYRKEIYKEVLKLIKINSLKASFINNLRLKELIYGIITKLYLFLKDKEGINLLQLNQDDKIQDSFVYYFQTLYSLFLIIKKCVLNGIIVQNKHDIFNQIRMILVYINGYFPYNQHYIMNCNYLNDSIKETYRTVQTNFNQQFFIENYFESNSNITIIEQIFELKYNINFNDNDRIILNYGKLNCISFVIQHFVLSNEEDILLYLSSQLTNEDQACILSNLLKLVDEIISVYYLNISNETESNEIESFQHQLSQTLLILISFYQKYKVGRWEQIFLSYIVNGGYFTYQLIIKVWNIVYSGLNESVQLDHFKALTHLLCLHLDNEIVYERIGNLIHLFILQGSRELRLFVAKEMLLIIKNFETDPIKLLVLTSCLPLNQIHLHQNYDTKMEKVILAAFNKNSHLIYSNNYLTKWMYKSLSQLFYCFSEENLSINLIEKLLTNSIKCLNNYCSFYKNSIDLMLINSWLNMVAYIPLLILDQIIIETLTILKKYIINFNEEIEYLLILQIILRGCDLQFSNEERKIKFIQLSKSIIRRMFEQKDWCLHFVGLWMMTKFAKLKWNIGIELIVSSSLRTMFMEYLKREEINLLNKKESNNIENLLTFMKEFLTIHLPSQPKILFGNGPQFQSNIIKCVNILFNELSTTISNYDQQELIVLSDKINEILIKDPN